MHNKRQMEVVFLTTFADYSYRSIPAIAQMADDLAIRLTIVHSLSDRRDPSAAAEARAQLESFFPEADAYADCERRLTYGDPVDAVRHLQETQPVDLVIAPAADPLGLPRIGHRSLRARLIRQCCVPLWTIGRQTDPSLLRTRARHVACWVDFDDSDWRHVAYALEYARKLEASLNILHALPATDENLLFAGERPLTEEVAIRELRKRIGWAPVPLHFHVAVDSSSRAQARLLQRSGAGILFIGDKRPHWDWRLSRKPRLLDECICPVICVPVDIPTPIWDLEPETSTVAATGALQFVIHDSVGAAQ